MFKYVLAIAAAVLGIFLGILYSKFVIKDYPDYKRKFGYFITVTIFLAFSLMLFGIISINFSVKTTIKEYAIKIDQYVGQNFPDNEFVKNGLDLKSINDDISRINNTVSGLKSIFPTHKELGINKWMYDLIVDYTIKELQKRLTIVNYSAKFMNQFVDKNNMLTVSSTLSGLRTSAAKLINIITLIIISIFCIGFLVYIIYSLNIARRERKFNKVPDEKRP